MPPINLNNSLMEQVSVPSLEYLDLKTLKIEQLFATFYIHY